MGPGTALHPFPRLPCSFAPYPKSSWEIDCPYLSGLLPYPGLSPEDNVRASLFTVHFQSPLSLIPMTAWRLGFWGPQERGKLGIPILGSPYSSTQRK